jgi:putative ABC transport system permease protein
MLRNYFTIIFRNLRKNKLFTFINFISLGICIVSIIWGSQNYRRSYSYDNFYRDAKNNFRILSKATGNFYLKGIYPKALATAAKKDFIALKKTVRWYTRRHKTDPIGKILIFYLDEPNKKPVTQLQKPSGKNYSPSQ